MTQSGTIRRQALFAGFIAAALAVAFVTAGSLENVALAQKGKKKKGDKGKKKPPPKKEVKIPKDKTPPLFSLKGHKWWIYTISVSSNGKYAVTASRDKTIKIWDLAAKKELHTLKDYKRDVKRQAVISPDGKRVVSTTWKVIVTKKKDKKLKIERKIRTFHGEIKIWDATNGKEVKSIKGHSGFIESLAISPDGKSFVTGSQDMTAIVWNLADGKKLHELKGHKGTILDIAYSSDGKQIATAGSDKLVKLWNAADGKEIKSLKGPGRMVTAVAFSPDGKQVAAASLDEHVFVFNVGDGKEARKMKVGKGLWSVAWSPDGKSIAACGLDDTAKVFNAADGKERFYRNGHKGNVLDVAFTSNNRMITVGTDQVIQVWEVPKQ